MVIKKHANYNTFDNKIPIYRENNHGSTSFEEASEDVRYRNIIAFWFLGLCTDFGYWIILTGAHDLISQGENTSLPVSQSGRECNQLSTGVILIVNVIPNFIMKTFLPFLPLWIHARIFIAVVLSVTGFSIAACNQMHFYILLGIGLCSIAVGIWTSSFLMYIPSFNDERVVKAWCSGCGSSGFLASLTYLTLTALGVTLSRILSFMMIIPFLMALVFWLLLEHPEENIIECVEASSFHHRKRLEACHTVIKLFCKFTIPYFLVFFCQYLINQGLFELIFIKNNFIDVSTQVRWFTFIYLIAVLIASSSSCIKINCLWFLVLLQGVNLAFVITEAIYSWLGNTTYTFWVVVVIIFWEGLVAGTSYMNTYRRINDEIPSNSKQFSMSINSIGATMGMTLAGFIAIPLHNYICNLPPP